MSLESCSRRKTSKDFTITSQFSPKKAEKNLTILRNPSSTVSPDNHAKIAAGSDQNSEIDNIDLFGQTGGTRFLPKHPPKTEAAPSQELENDVFDSPNRQCEKSSDCNESRSSMSGDIPISVLAQKSKRHSRRLRRSGNNLLFYPENKYLMNWDLFMILALITTCFLTPLAIAFSADSDSNLMISNYIIDILFAIDILVIFNTAYYDDYFKVIESRKLIAKKYITGWFVIDFLAIFPFDLIMNVTDVNSLARFARIGRLYKLIKLTKLLRVFKIIKDKNKFMKILTDRLKIGSGLERLLFFGVLSIIMCHIVSCLWIMLPSIVSTDE